MDILEESRLTFRQGHTAQPFAMVSGKQVRRYQDVPKESQTRGLPTPLIESFGNFMLIRSDCTFVSVVSVQAKPQRKGQQCRPHLGGEGRVVQRHMHHSLCVSATQSTRGVV